MWFLIMWLDPMFHNKKHSFRNHFANRQCVCIHHLITPEFLVSHNKNLMVSQYSKVNYGNKVTLLANLIFTNVLYFRDKAQHQACHLLFTTSFVQYVVWLSNWPPKNRNKHWCHWKHIGMFYWKHGQNMMFTKELQVLEEHI
jgi:hypothetical protein